MREADGRMAIAKFPQRSDQHDVELWEAVTLALAERSGITTPKWRIERISEIPVLLLSRFDRSGQRRIPFLSAMSMLGARHDQARSYLEIADALRRHGASPDVDLQQLWRRMVFNVLASNTVDHLRNHGFLYEGAAGWRLAPAYDLNPVPVEIKPRLLSTSITFDSAEASLELAMEVAEEFGLGVDEAKGVVREVGAAVSQWRPTARRLGIADKEIAKMASAFEHPDLETAKAM